MWVYQASNSTEENKCLAQGRLYFAGENLNTSLLDYHSAQDLIIFFEDENAVDYATAQGWADECWLFAHEMQAGDMVILSNVESAELHLGEVAGDYDYDAASAADLAHFRPVKWFQQGIDRASIPATLRKALAQSNVLSQIEEDSFWLQTVLEAWEKNPPATATAVASAVAPASSAAASTNDLSPEEELILQIDKQIKNGTLTVADILSSIIHAKGFNVKVLPDSTKLSELLLASSPNQNVKVLFNIKHTTGELSASAFDMFCDLASIYECHNGIIFSWDGFTDELQQMVAMDSEIQTKLWGPKELANELINLFDKLDPKVQTALS